MRLGGKDIMRVELPHTYSAAVLLSQPWARHRSLDQERSTICKSSVGTYAARATGSLQQRYGTPEFEA